MAQVDAARTEIERLISQARELQKRNQIESAYELLCQKMASHHPRLSSDIDHFTSLRNELSELRQRQVAIAKEAIDVARLCIKQGDYPGAQQHLTPIARNHRGDEATQICHTVDAAMDEIRELTSRLRAAIAAEKLDGMVSVVGRLKQLDSRNERWPTLETELCRRQVKLATQHWRQQDHGETVRLLTEIPEVQRDAAATRLLQQAEELHLLHQELRSAPYIDPYMIAVVRRLVGVAANDEAVTEKCRSLMKRVAESNRRKLLEVRGEPRRTPGYLGMPVSLVDDVNRIGMQHLVGEGEGRLVIPLLAAACGLALQSMGLATVTTSLSTVQPRGLRGKWEKLVGRRKRAADLSHAGWGIDLGGSGMRAVKLALDADGKCCIERWHAVNSTRGPQSVESEMTEIDAFRASVSELVEQMEYDGDPVTIGVSGIHILHRMLILPPTTPDKLEAAIRFESKHQIPFDLSEVRWDYHVFHPVQTDDGTPIEKPVSKGDIGKSPGLHACLIASKQWRIDEILSIFTELGIAVQAVQSNCLAIHNWAAYARNGGLPAACLDIGFDSTDLIVVTPDRCWIRSWGCGTKDISAALVKRLHLTHDQARSVIFNTLQAKRLYPVMAAIEPVYQLWEREIRMSLNNLAQAAPDLVLPGLTLLGGGTRAPGFVRFLTHGPLLED